MEKMSKKTIAINVMPQTKVKLDEIRKETGLPIGVIIDKLVMYAREEMFWIEYSEFKNKANV